MMNYHHPAAVEPVLNFQSDISAMEDVESDPETSYTKCGEIFVSKSGNFLYLCETCNITFSNIQLFSEHGCVAHILTNSNNDSEILQNEKMESGISSSETPDIEDHTNSIEQVNKKSRKKIRFSGTKLYLCETCNITFSNIQLFSEHGCVTRILTNSINDSEILQNETKMESGISSSESPDIEDHTNSIEQVNKKSRKKIRFSGTTKSEQKTIKDKKDIKKILKIDTDEQKLQKMNDGFNHACHFCGKTFKLNTTLVIHTRTHTGERPFECSYCPSKFRSKSLLVLHIRTHTGEKPYSCTYCCKSFAGKSNLYVHERIHTLSLPYQCYYCDKRFNQKSAKLTHEKKKHSFLHENS